MFNKTMYVLKLRNFKIVCHKKKIDTSSPQIQ